MSTTTGWRTEMAKWITDARDAEGQDDTAGGSDSETELDAAPI